MSAQPMENTCENVVQEMILDEWRFDDVNQTIRDLELLSESTKYTLQKFKLQINGMSEALKEMKEELRRKEEIIETLTDENLSLRKENGQLSRNEVLYDKAFEKVNKLNTKTEFLENLVQENEGKYKERENNWFRENEELKKDNTALKKKLDEHFALSGKPETPTMESQGVGNTISNERPRYHEFQENHFQTNVMRRLNRPHRRGRLYLQNRPSKFSTFVTVSSVKSPPE